MSEILISILTGVWKIFPWSIAKLGQSSSSQCFRICHGFTSLRGNQHSWVRINKTQHTIWVTTSVGFPGAVRWLPTVDSLNTAFHWRAHKIHLPSSSLGSSHWPNFYHSILFWDVLEIPINRFTQSCLWDIWVLWLGIMFLSFHSCRKIHQHFISLCC